MINMQDLKKILMLVLATGNLKGVKPVSLLVVSKSGNGKTELITSIKSKKGCYITDLSATGLLLFLEKDTKMRHIIIPDFIKITQKKKSTSENLVSLLNALTDEGVGKTKLFNVEKDFSNRTIGLITATTKASFGQHRTRWESFGFVQRMLFVSYDYSEETIQKIMESINKEEYIKEKKDVLIASSKDVISEEKFNKQLNRFVDKNFRSLKHLQALAKANAMMRGSKFVEQCDIDEIIRLTKFMNLKYTKI